MSGVFSSKYSDEQRAAIVAAFDERGMTAPAVADLARRGELEHEGEPLAPFEVPASTVRSLARDARRRRSGAMRSDLANAAPGDALEDLRRRLVSAIDHELRQIERRQRAGEVVKGEELRQLGRARRELAARSGPIDSRPPLPGARVNGEREGGLTRGGLAGALLADHRATGARTPAPHESGIPNRPTSEAIKRRQSNMVDSERPHESPIGDSPSSEAVAGESDDDVSPAALVARFEAGEEIRREDAKPAEDAKPVNHGALTADGFDYSRLAAEDVTAIERSERGRDG
jgi:hypothetical protein